MTKRILYWNKRSNMTFYVTPVYTYEVNVYIINKGRTELDYSKVVQSVKPIKLKSNTSYVKKGKTIILTTIDWISAPKNFLEGCGFEPIDTNEYIKLYKNSHKKSKKK